MNELDMPFKENTEDFCPDYSVQPQNKPLKGDEELVFPLNKRCIVQYSPAGLELYLYYGDKEISFDEPELFAFGEQLAKQSRFVAKAALTWGNGLDWPRVKALLEQLLAEGVLKYADEYANDTVLGRDIHCPSPLPPAQTSVARTWFECEAISRELTGRAFELAYLELVVPVFRVAHIVMDAEGRQVGEANVFPKPLRLDVPTEWRTCPYSGSRYLADKPMNVTALRSMSSHWPQMMCCLLRIREAYLQRYPSARQSWTVGGLEALATLVLAVPTFQLMRQDQAGDNGRLHPVLSNMFRVTDGLRMVMHQMIFIPVGEPTLPPHAPMTSAEIHAYSERNYAFTSEHGVCAGPKVMIEDFLNVLVNGVPSKEAESIKLDEPVEAALANLAAAFDYGLYGLQVYATVFSLWPVMARTYTQLWRIMEDWPKERTDAILLLRDRLQTQINILNTQTYHTNEEWRTQRELAYSEIYAHCALGLGLPTAEKTLTEQIAPAMREEHRPVFEKLRTLLYRFSTQDQLEFDLDMQNLLTCLMNYFLQVQAILRLACQAQQQINKLLDRAEADREFDAGNINIHNLLQGDADKRLAYLTDELELVFRIRIEINKNRITITDIENSD